jgi:hypothetical protein
MANMTVDPAQIAAFLAPQKPSMLMAPPAAPVVAAPAAGPGVLQSVGNFLQDHLPTLNAARQQYATDYDTNVAKGQYAQASGNAVGMAAKMVPLAISDAASAPISGVGHFLSGLFGGSKTASDSDAIKSTPTAPVGTPRAAGVAMAQPVAPVSDSPQSMLAHAISGILSRPFSIADVEGLASAVPASVKPVHTLADQAAGAIAQKNEDLFQADMRDGLAKANGDANSPIYADAHKVALKGYIERGKAQQLDAATAALLTPKG